MAKKYYVVWEGNNIGVFDSWAKCQLQIKGYPNAKYKSFKTKEAAQFAFKGSFADHIGVAKKKSKPVISDASRAEIIWDSIAVDAACSGNPGNMEYRGVHTKSGDEIFKVGVFKKGTNNVGEFLALVHGLAYLQQSKEYNKVIYTDSRTAMAWVRNRKVKTSLKKSRVNERLFELIDRGEKWLKANSYKNPVVKWKTEEWGEIPADFGRK